jgi:hypothetical protein
VQHIKIYLPCNFEVNPITHFDRLCKLDKGNQIYFKIAGYVDLDMLKMFAVSTYHLSLIVFEIKDDFEVNPITHFDRLCKLEKKGDEV